MLTLTGFIAATFTPFRANGELNLHAVEGQAHQLLLDGVRAVFVAGTTGECSSLTVPERRDLVQRWAEVCRDKPLSLVVHVGSNCLADSQSLAEHAQRAGAVAISAFAPSYFKPKNAEVLVEWCARIAASAPDLPFYYYDIPPLTGVMIAPKAVLELAAKRIPNFRGLKFSNPDQVAFQECLNFENGRFDVPWGIDECILAAFALGATGGVGSTYNFAMPLYQRLVQAFSCGDMIAAREEQFRSVQLVAVLAKYGYFAAAKCLMLRLGVDVGTPRMPHMPLEPEAREAMFGELERIGFFDWGR